MQTSSLRRLLPLAASLITIALPPAARAGYPERQEADVILGDTRLGVDKCRPSGVAIDPVSGKCFVAEYVHSRVLRYASVNDMLTGAKPEIIIGQMHEGDSHYACSQTRLAGPTSVHCDAIGRLWIADSGNNRVVRLDNAALPAANAPAFSRVLGQPDFNTRVPATAANRMNYPRDVKMDSAGTLYVADTSNDRVLVFKNAASALNGAAANIVLGQPDMNTLNGNGDPLTLATTMNSPMGMFVEKTSPAGSDFRLWVCDYWQHRVLRFDSVQSASNGTAASCVLGQPDFTSKFESLDRLSYPISLASDGAGNLYVGDQGHSRILRWGNAGTLSNGAPPMVVIGQPDFNTAAAQPSAVGIHPWSLTFNGPGMLLVTDTHYQRIAWYQNPAQAVGLAPLAGGTAPRVLFSGPQNNHVDQVSGKMFVKRGDTDAVLRYANHAAFCAGAAPEATFRDEAMTDWSGDAYIGDLATGPSGELWVSCPNSSVVIKFNNAVNGGNRTRRDGYLGVLDTEAGGPSGFDFPYKLLLKNNRLWVGDFSNHRIMRFDNPGGKADGAPADGQIGQADFNSLAIGTTGANRFKFSGDMDEDETGMLWICDPLQNRVLGFPNAASVNHNLSATRVLGQSDFTTTTSGSTLAKFFEPRGLIVKPGGRIYVADAYNNRVLVWHKPKSGANGKPADEVLCAKSSTSDAPTTETGINRSRLDSPFDLTHDGAGGLWIDDSGNDRLLHFPALETELVSFTTTPAGNNTSWTITWNGHAQHSYWIDFSTDMVNWVPHSSTMTNALGAGSKQSFTGSPRLFFRVREGQ